MFIIAPPAALENVTVIPWTVLALIRWNLKDDGGYPIINITVRYKDATKEENWRYVNQHLISLTRVSGIDNLVMYCLKIEDV